MEGDNKFSICRLCLSSNNTLVHVFEKKRIHGYSPADVIIELLRQEVSAEDVYPQCVCVECIGKLKNFKKFKDRCAACKELIDRAYATKHIISMQIKQKENDSNWDEGSDDAVDMMHADIPPLEPKVELDEKVDWVPIVDNTRVVAKGESSTTKGELRKKWSHKTRPEIPRDLVIEPVEECDWESSTDSVGIFDQKDSADTKSDEIGSQLPLDYSTGGKSSNVYGKKTEPDLRNSDLTDREYAVNKVSCHSKDSQSATEAMPKEGGIKRKSFECLECRKRYTTLNRYHRHMLEHKFEGNSTTVNPTEEKVDCKVCGKTLKNKNALRSHMSVHGDKKFKCDECGKEFVRHYELKLHMTSHSQERIHKCDICDKLFHNKGLLMQHKYSHKGGRPKKYDCSECDRKFSSPSLLVAHMRTHTGEKPFSCHRCSERFSLKSNLRVHIRRRHTDRVPMRFQCDECEQHFSCLQTLTHHKKIKHLGVKDFKCQECEQEFTHKHSLSNHVKYKHKK